MTLIGQFPPQNYSGSMSRSMSESESESEYEWEYESQKAFLTWAFFNEYDPFGHSTWRFSNMEGQA